MEVLLNLTMRYPWLNSFKEYHPDMASQDPLEFISEVFLKYPQLELQKKIKNFFNAAFDNLEEIPGFNINEISIYFYLFLKILVYIFSNKRITNRVANLYSKIVNSELQNERDSNLLYICQDLGLDVRQSETKEVYKVIYDKNQHVVLKTNFLINFKDYLNLSTNLKDDYRKLINNPLRKGYVYIEKRTLVRLLQEHVRNKFLLTTDDNAKSIQSFKKNLLKVNEFKDLYDDISNLWDLKKESFDYSTDIKYQKDKDLVTAFPPCVKEILIKAQENQNLIHIERLFLVFFLNALSYPLDEIIDIFSTLPDFNRDKTKYQVEFAKKKGYVPHSCQTLKSLNLCMASKYKDDLCLKGYTSKKDKEQKKISHPLFYLQFKQYPKEKKDKNSQSKQKHESKE
ncbi:MAG: hypothetical protein ACFFB1_11965 [Promethearchaeota archaeon]